MLLDQDYIFIIEEGINIPKKKTNRRTIYPFDLMKKGDSFFVPFNKFFTKNGKKYRTSHLSAAASYWGKKHGRSFKVRVDEKDGITGLRCWRVDDNGNSKIIKE